MKYILLMSGTMKGVESYHAWTQKDIEAHMAILWEINNDLTKSGEFVATQGLAEPRKAMIVRGEHKRPAGDRWNFPGVEGVSVGLLDCRRSDSRPRLCHRGPHFGGAGAWRSAYEHAD